MNLVRYCFTFVFAMLAVNRVIFSYDAFLKMNKERANDINYFRKVCSTIDYKELGRHAAACVETEHRLETSVLFQTAKVVVDDTLYRELNFGLMSQVAAVTGGIFLIGAINNKYQRTVNERLPTIHKKNI